MTEIDFKLKMKSVHSEHSGCENERFDDTGLETVANCEKWLSAKEGVGNQFMKYRNTTHCRLTAGDYFRINNRHHNCNTSEYLSI